MRLVLPHFVCVVALCAAHALAAPPTISRLSVRGLQIGGTTRIEVQGTDLLPEPKLLGGVPIKEMKLLEGATDRKVELEVIVDAGATPGVFPLRLANSNGVSAAEIIAVDTLPQRPIAPPGSDKKPIVETLPVALHGSVGGSQVQELAFAGKAGEKVTLDLIARRLGAKLRPVVHLYGPDRRPIEWRGPMVELADDVRLSLALPVDGVYTVTIHDQQYAGPSPGHFRLAIGQFEAVDLVDPPAIAREGAGQVRLLGLLASPLVTEKAQILAGRESARPGDWLPIPWPAGLRAVGLRPKVQLSELREVTEERSGAAIPDIGTVPVGLSGKISATGEEDVYQLAVAEGDKLRFEVWSDRIGGPLDLSLEIRNEQGQRLAQNDDAANSPDPRLDYTAAKGISRVQIAIREAVLGGPTPGIYRLTVTRQPQKADRPDKPDFKLTFSDDTQHLSPQGTQIVRVAVDRLGYEGPIKLAVEGLPSGVSVASSEIAPNMLGALLEFKGSELPPGWVASLKIRGESVAVQPPIARLAMAATHPLGELQPWLKEEMLLAGVKPAAKPLQLAWGDVGATPPIYSGLDGKLAVKLQRGPGATGPIRLTLVTSQGVPLQNGQPNQNAALRTPQPNTDIPADGAAAAALTALEQAEKVLTDLEKKKPSTGEPDAALAEQIKQAAMKREEAQKKLQEAEAKVKAEAELLLVVPNDLPAGSYEFAVKAELRSADNQRVIAECWTPIRRVAGLLPYAMQLAGPPELEAKLDPKEGASVKWSGKVERLGGATGEVTITVVNVPGGVSAPRVVLKPDQTAFDVELKLPPSLGGDKIEGMKLSASGPPDEKKANQLVKVELPISVKITRPPTPAK